MCGLCGIFYHDARRELDPDLLGAMRDVMTHRGPDGAGTYCGPGIGLGHRRLKVIDLSEAGRQPMAGDDGQLQLVYNGEMYNFAEMRERLLEAGYSFRSTCDTEVLLRLYEEMGEAMVHHVKGIFTFAIYDRRADALFLARDRLGVKPLYYAAGPDAFYFASEVKSLLAAGVEPRLNRDAVGEYLAFHHVGGRRTLFDNVYRLLPGHSVTIHRGDTDVCSKPYWSVFDAADGSSTPNAALGDVLASAVSRQMMSDVPVGTMCSGGLDSSGLTALASQVGESSLKTFSVVFDDQSFDESKFARRVSDRYGTDHREIRSDAAYYAEQWRYLTWLNDEPLNAPNAVPIHQLARQAKGDVTVLLSGEGADELFGGYGRQRRFKSMLPWRAFAGPLRGVLRRAGRRIRGGRWQRLIMMLAEQDDANALLWSSMQATPSEIEQAGYKGGFSWPYRNSVSRRAIAGTAEQVQGRLLYDQLLYLEPLLNRQDKMCMGASIECRVPYLDEDVVEFANRLSVEKKINGRRGKAVLRDALSDLLPSEIVERRKFGFAVPVMSWLRENAPLRQVMQEVMEQPDRCMLVRFDVFEPGPLSDVIRTFLAGDDSVSPTIWPIISLEVWLQVFFGRTSPWTTPANEPVREPAVYTS